MWLKKLWHSDLKIKYKKKYKTFCKTLPQNMANKQKTTKPFVLLSAYAFGFGQKKKNSPHSPAAPTPTPPSALCAQWSRNMDKCANMPNTTRPSAVQPFPMSLLFSTFIPRIFHFGRFLFSAFATLLRGFGLRCGTFVSPTTPTSLAAHFATETKNKIDFSFDIQGKFLNLYSIDKLSIRQQYIIVTNNFFKY